MQTGERQDEESFVIVNKIIHLACHSIQIALGCVRALLRPYPLVRCFALVVSLIVLSPPPISETRLVVLDPVHQLLLYKGNQTFIHPRLW